MSKSDRFTTVRGAGASTTVFALVALVAFITSLDNTVVASAVPSIGRDLGLPVAGLQWIGLSYMLAFGLLLIPAGILVDRTAVAPCMLVACAVFAAASVWGALAWDLAGLAGARAAQGCAAAVLVTGTLSLLRTALDERRRTAASAVWTASLAIALAVGPIVGGAVSEHLHWSWIFLLNLPFAGAVALVVARRVRGPVASGSIVATWREALPASLLTSRVFVGSLLATVLWGLGVSGLVFFTPLVFAEAAGLGPTGAALPLTFVAVALVLATPAVAPAVSRFGHRTVCIAGLAVVAGGLVAVAAVPGDAGVAVRLPGLLIVGLGSAFTAPLTVTALDEAGEGQAGAASGLLTTGRELSSAAGVALVGGVLSTAETAALGTGRTDVEALSLGYAAALVLTAGLQCVAIAVVVATIPGRSR